MNNKINKYIFESITKKYEGTCSKEKGYFIKVNKVNKIIETFLTEDVELYFICNCNVDVL